MVRLAIFVAVSAALAYLSRASLRTPGSHGFFRFFAWECTLGVILLSSQSYAQWFGDPFSLRQLASWALLTGSLVPLALGLRLLLTVGRPDAELRRNEPLLGIEKTTRLVTTGIFGHIRHPLYSSLLLLTWGVFLKRPSWIAGGLALAATGLLVATAKAEEAENLRYFGPAYRTYMRRTKRFVPRLF